MVAVTSVGIRFGGTISSSAWNSINAQKAISDYGIMLLKKNTLTSYGFDSVEEAYDAKDNNKPVTVLRKGSNEAPYLDGNNYLFTVKVNVKEANYGVVFCAAPFIVAGGRYYFFDDIEFSVRTLAQEYIGNASYRYLSQEALSLLAGN